MSTEYERLIDLDPTHDVNISLEQAKSELIRELNLLEDCIVFIEEELETDAPSDNIFGTLKEVNSRIDILYSIIAGLD